MKRIRIGNASALASGASRTAVSAAGRAAATLSPVLALAFVLAACADGNLSGGGGLTDRGVFRSAALGPSLLSSRGVADYRTAPVVALFETIDANGDGHLSASEIEGHTAMRFARHDANGDGALDLQELGLAAAPPEARILPFDSDGDGRMSVAEEQAYITTVISESSGTDMPTLYWHDVDRRLVR